MNNKVGIGIVVAAVIAVVAYAVFSNRTASAGPNGGDLVPLADEAAYAEVLANEEGGDVMTYVWEEDLKTPHPIPSEPITMGSGSDSMELMPHPQPNDPAGMCSRFYGQADWVRGGHIRQGWLATESDAQRQQFAWNNCWRGGRGRGPMWQDMREHHGMMGPGGHMGMGPGMHGPHGGQVDQGQGGHAVDE